MLRCSIFALAFSSQTLAWGLEGHAIVAQIAQNYLNPNAAQQVNSILSSATMDSVASWADSFKFTANGMWSRQLHFLDIKDAPPNSCGLDESRDCPKGNCINTAIANFTGQACSSDPTIRKESLQFLIHFMGDITQPLHNSQRDIGGNSDKVTYAGAPANLHSIWDTQMVEQREATQGGRAGYVAYLIKEIDSGSYQSQKESWVSSQKFDAISSFGNNMASIEYSADSDLAVCSYVYKQFDTAPSSDLSGSYYTGAVPIIDLQLAKGGFRLAAQLNSIYDSCGSDNGPTTTVQVTSSTRSPPQTTTEPSVTTSRHVKTKTTRHFAAEETGSSFQQTPIDRVFLIILENANYADVVADPYLGPTLMSKGRLLTNYHASQPNYIALITGATQGFKGDTSKTVVAKNIVDLLEAKQKSWTSYQEGLPGVCSTVTNSGTYFRKHNPFISMSNIQKNAARCAKIVSADQLQTDIQNGSVADYVWYTPDINNDGHDTGIAYSSKWMKGFLEPLLANPIFANTLFIVTYDESQFFGDNQIYTMLIGPGATPGSTDPTAYTHYSHLATVEQIFRLDNLNSGDVSAASYKLN